MTQYLMCKVGDILHNTNGSDYRVLRDSKRGASFGETPVVSIGSRFPWVCIAHDIRLYGDGQIDWSHSDGLGFVQFIDQSYGSVDKLLDKMGF